MLPPSLKTERAKLADFYAARSEAIPPLPWQTFPPPFSLRGGGAVVGAKLLIVFYTVAMLHTFYGNAVRAWLSRT